MLLLVAQHHLVDEAVREQGAAGSLRSAPSSRLERALAHRLHVAQGVLDAQVGQRAALVARRRERVVHGAQVAAQRRAAVRVLHQPQVLEGGDVTEVPRDRAHQRVVHPVQRLFGDSVDQQQRARAGLLQPRRRSPPAVARRSARRRSARSLAGRGSARSIAARAVSFDAGRGLVAHRRGDEEVSRGTYPIVTRRTHDRINVTLRARLPSVGRTRVAQRRTVYGPARGLQALGTGDIVAAAGGLLLFLSLFLPWFSVSGTGQENLCGAGSDDCSGFETFTILDIPVCWWAPRSRPGSWSGSWSAVTSCRGRRARSR